MVKSGDARPRLAMSQQDVELVRRAMEAWNREDIDQPTPLSDPEVEFVSIFAGMDDLLPQ
jgi:hypothetical protein